MTQRQLQESGCVRHGRVDCVDCFMEVCGGPDFEKKEWPDWRVPSFYMLGGWILGNTGAGFWLVVIVSSLVWVGLLISMCRRPPRHA